MISRNLSQRLKRLESKLQQQWEPEMKPADAALIRRLYAARRRMALLGYAGYEAFAPSGEPEPQPEIHPPPPRDPTVEAYTQGAKG